MRFREVKQLPKVMWLLNGKVMIQIQISLILNSYVFYSIMLLLIFYLPLADISTLNVKL